MKDVPVILGQRGRTTIPLPLRRKLGWQPGDTINFRLKGDAVIVTCLREKPKPRPRLLVLLIGGGGDG